MSRPGGTLLLLLIIGILIGVLIHRYTGTNWRRHIAGTLRGQLTSGLVGIAGSFVGFHIVTIIASDRPIGITMIAAGAGASVVVWAWKTVDL